MQWDAVATHLAADPDDEAAGAGPLGDHGGRRRCTDAHVQPEHEDELQDQVQDGRAHGHPQRPDGVAQPTQVADPGQHQQHRRCSQEADPQVGACVAGRLPLRSQHPDEAVGHGGSDHGQDHAEAEGQPEALDGLLRCPMLFARSAQPGDRCGRAVRQEDAEAVAEHERAGGHPEATELCRAQMPDDGSVGQHVEGFGQECSECRYRQPQELPVVAPQAESKTGVGDHRASVGPLQVRDPTAPSGSDRVAGRGSA